jgi:hypothetical protein
MAILRPAFYSPPKEWGSFHGQKNRRFDKPMAPKTIFRILNQTQMALGKSVGLLPQKTSDQFTSGWQVTLLMAEEYRMRWITGTYWLSQ